MGRVSLCTPPAGRFELPIGRNILNKVLPREENEAASSDEANVLSSPFVLPRDGERGLPGAAKNPFKAATGEFLPSLLRALTVAAGEFAPLTNFACSARFPLTEPGPGASLSDLIDCRLEEAN